MAGEPATLADRKGNLPKLGRVCQKKTQNRLEGRATRKRTDGKSRKNHFLKRNQGTGELGQLIKPSLMRHSLDEIIQEFNSHNGHPKTGDSGKHIEFLRGPMD